MEILRSLSYAKNTATQIRKTLYMRMTLNSIQNLGKNKVQLIISKDLKYDSWNVNNKVIDIVQFQQMKARVLPSLKRIPHHSNKTLSVPDSLKTIITQIQKIVPLGRTPIAELDLKWKGQQDYEEIKYILQDILEFPSTDMADMHRDCNRLGTLDILENQSMLSKMLFEEGEPEIYCSCCGYLLQSQEIPLETSLRSIGNMGISTLLYFQTLILISILLGLLFLIYGIFALVTNVIAFNNYTQRETIASESNYLSISLSAKQLNQTAQNSTFYFIQCWLGLVVVIAWFIAFIMAKSFEKHDQILIDNRTKSAADFSIVIEGVPSKMTKQQLQKQLDAYYAKLTEDQKPKEIDRPFKIAKMNAAIPFYLTLDQFTNNELKSIIQQKNQLREQFVGWIIERKISDEFSTPKNLRIKAYNKYRGLQNDIDNQYRSIVDQIVGRMIQKTHTQPTTSVFITFETNYAKDLICHLNSPEDAVFNLKDYFCWDDSAYFNIRYESEVFRTKIKSAPEPEDIIWTNIGQSLTQFILRKLLTYSITAIILGGSFVIIFFLSKEQVKNNNDAFLSFVISFSITAINIIIQIVIRALTTLEREVTQTQFQTNLAIKSIIAQLINSILLPFVVKYQIQQNLYKTDGLAFVVFSMGITNALLLPALKLINLDHLVFLIKAAIYKKVMNKLNITQTELNSVNTLSPFETGTQYIYPVNLFLFVCFYASLQPIICIFGLAGLGLMYWVQKHALFTRSRRPYPGNDLVNRAMYRILYIGPFIFSLGNLTWSNLIQGGGPQSAIIPNLIAISISAVFMLIPYKGFFSRLIKQNYEQEMIFEDNRIYLTSEYDRLNPATAKQAMNEYYKFLREYKEKIQNLSQEEIIRLEELLLSQKQKGNMDPLKLSKLFTQIILEQPGLKENKPFMKEQSSYQDHMSVEQNHVVIKQDSIEELKVKKKRNNKNFVTADQLFRQFCVNQQNSLTFVQNWILQPERLITQHLLIQTPMVIKEQTQNNNSDVKVQTNMEEKKKQIRVPEFKINKPVTRPQISYNLLKNLLTGYQKQFKEDMKDNHKKKSNSKPSKVQNEDEIKIENTNRHEESRFKLNVNVENNKNGFLGLILNEGATLISQPNKK